ncbi:hypothetical protein ACHAWF_002946 [Thalassiosira exigua]
MRSASALLLPFLAFALPAPSRGLVPPSRPSSLLPSASVRARRSSAAARTTTTTRLRSVPSSLDTLTSGLASMSRLPRGVSVSPDGISSAGPAASFLPVLKELYDVESDRECRTVRERITELDLVVGRVIPSAEGSKARAEKEEGGGELAAPTLVVEVDGREETFVGAEDILEFFDDKFSAAEKKGNRADERADAGPEGDEVQMTLERAKERLIDFASYLPGILRAGRGSKVCSAASTALNPPRPAKPLILYSYEGNQFCRLVREILTELDLPYELRSAGKGSPRREELAALTGGSSQCPYLIDPNTGASMPESQDIAEYLYSTYALWTPPSELLRTASDVVTPLLAPLYRIATPLQAGSKRENEYEYASDVAEAKAEIYEDISSRPVVIYTYELSPFCAEAVALLERIGVAHREISLGREWIPGLLTEPARRAALLDMTGQSSLPHVFVGGTSVGGLYSGSPGLVPSLERGEFVDLVEEAKRSM